MPLYNVINGVSNSKVEIYNAGRRILNVTLPLTGLSGLQEMWDEVPNTHGILGQNTSAFALREKKTIHGFFGNWILTWDTLPMKASDIVNVIAIMNQSNRNQNIIYLTPRIDNVYSTRYEVNNMSGELHWTQMKGGITAPGNQGIALRFRTVDMQSNITAIQHFTIDPETPLYSVKDAYEGVAV